MKVKQLLEYLVRELNPYVDPIYSLVVPYHSYTIV